MNAFEEFLQEEHGKQFVGTKDMLIDDFESWIQNLSVDDWIRLGNRFNLDELRNEFTAYLTQKLEGLENLIAEFIPHRDNNYIGPLATAIRKELGVE